MLKTRSLYFFVFIILLVTSLFISATQAAEIIDPTFNAQIQTTTYRNKFVAQMVTLPDGKVLVSGNFNSYNGTAVGGLIRLNADASLDTTFNNELLATGSAAYSIIPLSDGKIILYGNLTLNNGTSPVISIIRLHANGTIDTSFSYQQTGPILDVQIDASDRVLVAGFIGVNQNGQTVTENIIRLTATGSVDSSFNAPPLSCIDRITAQNNKVVYTCSNIAIQQKELFRLTEDGTPDNSFTTTLAGNPIIYELRTQADNKILILSTQRLVRMNENGGVDSNFQATTFNQANPRMLHLHSDGRITIAYAVGAPLGMKVIRLLQNGLPDPSFTPYDYLGAYFSGYTIQSDGSVLLGDESYNSSSNRFMRLLPNGVPDSAFNPGGSGFQNIKPGKIRAISVLPNEKILIGGDFDQVNSVFRTKIARLNADSTLDTSFQINTGGTGNYFSEVGDIYHIAVQSDGKLIISGNFKYFVGGSQKQNLVRLNSDGSIDPTFNLSLNINDWFLTSELGKNKPLQTSNGKILVGTSRINQAEPITIPLLLNAAGSKDTSFNPTIFNTKLGVAIFDIELQPDRKILIAGRHSAEIGTTATITKGFIARLNADGTIDQSFQIVEMADKTIFTFTVLPNGQILIVSRTNQQSSVLRLNSDGSFDDSFNSGAGANGIINAIAVLPNNKILVGGAFTTFNNQPRQNLALLNADGSLGESLGNINREVLCITVDNQGRVLIGGHFTSISAGSASGGAQNSAFSGGGGQSVVRTYLARLIVAPQTTRQTFFDFDGDGKADISVFRPTSGIWYQNQSQSGFSAVQFGVSTDKLTPADYDGDGKTDVAVFRDGNWYILGSQIGFTGVAFGQAGDIPVPADYDGDGKADQAVFRQGNWYILGSQVGFYSVAFGISTDKPTPADFDGDGKTDPAVFRDGIWYILGSQVGFYAVQFGQAGDKPVQADYDGDGKADPAVYRNGSWYLLRSQAGFTGIQFGNATDVPAPADYDGDSKADVAVFRDGVWYLLQSTSGFTAVQFGAAADKPVPNAFVP